jgi:hypothetical protein
LFCLALGFSFALAPVAQADFIGDYAVSNFRCIDTNADGCDSPPNGVLSITLTGGNNGSGFPGTTDFVTTATGTGVVLFDYSYDSTDDPAWDWAGFLRGSTFWMLADSSGQSGSASFPVTLGETFGFRVETADNTNEPGFFTITNFSAPSGGAPIPEPGSLPVMLALAGAAVWTRWQMRRARPGKGENA